LTYYEEQSAEQLAQLWSTSESNVRVLRFRALERLRRCIEGKEGHDGKV
jgi:DNA-directed RNA polymerase specialized sigma24 family protein